MKGAFLLQILLVLAAIEEILAQNATANATAPNYAPPPAITNKTSARLNNSAADSRYIGSKRIQSLEISRMTVNSTLKSMFKINFFNRSAPNNLNVYNVTLPGNWTYLTGTQETLSCNLVYQTINKTFGLLQFNSDQGTLNMLATADLSVFPDNIKAQVNSSMATFASNIFLGDLCRAGYYASNGSGVLYRLGQNKTSLIVITIPSGFSINAVTESFIYGIVSGKVYRLNSATGGYGEVFTLRQGQNYTIRAIYNRIVVTSANATNQTNVSNSSNTVLVNQTVYILKDEGSTSLKLLSAIDISSFQNGQRFIPVYSSPLLTKIGFSVTPVINTSRIIAKGVDYVANTVTDITFQDPGHYLTTLKGVNGDNSFDFSDYFLVVRNTTNAIPGGSYFEEAYQFVGSQIAFMRARPLVGRELTDFKKIIVDKFYTNKLIVLDSYNVTGGFEVVEYDFGNLAAMTKIVAVVPPPFISFNVSHSAITYPSDLFFTWAFKTTVGNSSKFTIIRANRTSPKNTEITQFSLNGSWSLLTQNQNCKLIRETTFISIFKRNSTTGNFSKVADVNTFLTSQNITVTNTTKWLISDQCDRFSAGQAIFTQSPINASSYRLVANNLSSFSWSASNSNLTLLIFGNSLYRYNLTSNSYTSYYASTTPILPNNRLFNFLNRIIIISLNGSQGSSQILAFTDDNAGNLATCLNYKFKFDSAPNFQVSPNLTNVLVIGPFTANVTNATVKPKADAFFIDYDNIGNKTISFPLEDIKDPMNTIIKLDQKFLYLRQINGAPTTSNPNMEIIYFLDQCTVPKIATKTNITAAMASSWKKSIIQITPQGKIFILVATMTTDGTNDTYNVSQVEVTAQQANFNNNSKPGITGYVVNGTIKLCSPGCSDCSSGDCAGCLSGFALETTTANCILCALNCLSCLSSDPKNCSSCSANSYLLGSSCLPCNKSCISCVGAADSCSTCPPGKFYNGSKCIPCGKNCQSCTNATVCTLCNRGFVPSTVNATSICRGCAVRCSSCNSSNITQCTSCAQGLQLVDGACIQCPQKCTSCSSNKCAVCISGYTPNDDGVCVKTCQLPCSTCIDNQPTACLSCYSGSQLVSNDCIINMNCSATSTCTDCGQGLGYILVSGQCLQCSVIENCVQCSTTNADICSICKQGYFVNDTTGCGSCPSECRTCVSQTACTVCVSGYTLAESQAQGQCLSCTYPCATCIGSTTYCTSCVANYTKKGWKCQNNSYVGFTIVLTATSDQVMVNLDSVITAILAIVKEDPTNVHTITFESIKNGSTAVDGTYTPTDGSVAVATTSLSSGLSSGSTLGSFTVNSASVSAFGVDDSTDISSNLGLIIGLSVSIPIVVIVAIIVSCYCYKKGRKISPILPSNSSSIQLESMEKSDIIDLQIRNRGANRHRYENNWEKHIIDIQ